MTSTTCRFCDSELNETMADLGSSPLCESFVPAEDAEKPEVFYPLVVRVCTNCWLAQLDAFVPREEIFDDYAYFSSYSKAWLEHSERYVDDMVERLGLDTDSKVIELASNDGYLLQYTVARGIDSLGIEPAANVAQAAIDRGVPTRVEFFGRESAKRIRDEFGQADLIAANNVLAQVPDLNDFVGGVPTVLAPEGTWTIEYPHLLRLLEENQFDTIYHEHFSYFSLGTTREIMRAHGLEVYDVEELWSHGGSLRVFVRHASDHSKPVTSAVEALIARETEGGLFSVERYHRFQRQVEKTKRELLRYLIEARERGDHIAAYGAPGKGNTLLNYCGIRTDLIDYAVDRNPYKHGRLTPGTHIPIHPPSRIDETKPNLIVILPWNLVSEIAEQLEYTREWGARLVVPIPAVREVPPLVG